MTDTPCKHLEALIQPEPSQSVRATPTGNIEQSYYESGAGYIIPKGIRDRSWEMQFRTKLGKTGLDEISKDILCLRFFYDMSLEEIAEELNFLSKSHVLKLLNDSLKYLKKIGFSK